MEFIRNYFGLNRRERRASLIISVLIVVVLAVRIFFPCRDVSLEYYSLAEQMKIIPDTEGTASAEIIPFDPNTAEFDVLVSAGFTSVQAGNIIRYREAGGKFRRPEDIYRLYTIDSSTAGRIIPYIIIESRKGKGEGRFQSGSAGRFIDINIADSAGFASLPGIGPVLASRIVKYRNLLGGFVTTGQLPEVFGITDSLFLRIESFLTADTSFLRKIPVNAAGVNVLARHPYITNRQANEICRLRRNGTVFRSVEELSSLGLIASEKTGLLKHYLDFGNAGITGKFSEIEDQ